MEATTSPRVVVGVDGSAASVRALTYAHAEATRAGTALRVVHVLPDLDTFVAPFVVPEEDLRQSGRQVVEDVLRRAAIPTEGAHAADGAVDVEVVLRHGRPGHVLVEEARAALLLVVGADRQSLAARLLTGNVTTGVAAGTVAPVVVVPETWPGAAAAGAPVVVGVEDPGHAFRAIGEACARADALRTRVVVLHTWQLPAAYEDAIADRVANEVWAERARRELAPLVAEWSEAFPGVPVQVEVRHGQAAHALVEESGTSAELVLGRPAHGIPGTRHLGATARAVLRGAHCPVRVVPPGRTVEVPPPALHDSHAIVG